MSNRPVCKFWRNGNCRNGANCNFLHGEPNSGGNSNNRFGAFNNSSNSLASRVNAPNSFSNQGHSRGGQGASSGPARSNARYNDDSVSRDIINNDLSNDKPAWPLSNWAGHQEAPRNIIDGIEVSPEEARVAYYLARLEGREQAAQQNEVQLANEAGQKFSRVLQDPEGARRYLNGGKAEHPNRWDHADRWDGKEGRAFTKREISQRDADSNNSNNGSSAFGNQQNSGFGSQQPSAFGSQQPSAFGSQQPSAFGSSGGSAFGQASSLGQSASPFGSAVPTGPAAAANRPAFGQSGFGQPAFGQSSAPAQPSAFGGAANAFGKPAFGQPSAFGSAAPQITLTGPTPPSSTFGNMSNTTASPFGQVANNNTSAFGQPSAFGGPSASTTTNNAFGAPSAPSAFGALTQQHKPTNSVDMSMGEQTPQTSAFGSFGGGARATAASPFGTISLSTAQPTSTPMMNGTLNTTAPSAFGAASIPSAPSGFGTTLNQPNAPKINGFGSAAPKTTSQRRDINISHILVNGQPPAANPETQAPPEMYGDKLSEYEKAYAYAASNNAFENDIIPELPPLTSWTTWV